MAWSSIVAAAFRSDWRSVSRRQASPRPDAVVVAMTNRHHIHTMDTVTPDVRSRMMAAIRGRDTKPEIRVRSLVHRLGYRFRLHRRDLPGSPDVVLPRLRICLFVHGCFWHRHPGCRAATTPKTRAAFWAEKFETNVARDARNEARLREMGWTIIIVWECETRDLAALRERLKVAFKLEERGA